MTVKTSAALLGAALVASTASAAAQPAAAQKCDIQSTGSAQVANAYEALGRFNGAETEAEKPKHLSAAVKLLSSAPDKEGPDVARQWVLGQTLVAWTLVDGQPSVGRRATFGYATEPEGTIDLLAAADTAFRAVEAAVPGCAAQIEQMRRLPYVQIANTAVELFNAGNSDSAKVLSTRALAIYPSSAPAYHLLGNIAIKDRDLPTATQMLTKAVELSKGDTSLSQLRVNALENLAALVQNEAQLATGPEQKELATTAADYFRELIELDPDNATAQNGLAQSLALTGDSVAVAGIYAKMISEPAGYSASQLLDAGIGAANGGRTQDAIGLLEAGLAKSPYYRDGLFALAHMYSSAEDYAKAAELSNRLIGVDPSNPDNYALLANSYQGMLSVATDNDIKKAYTDSLVRMSAKAQTLPVRVSFTDFAQPSSDQRVLNGTVENLTDQPADYTLKFEFLDEAGNVVATREEPVAGVAGKSSKSFSIAVEQAGIVAFRYAPLTL